MTNFIEAEQARTINLLQMITKHIQASRDEKDQYGHHEGHITKACLSNDYSDCSSFRL